MLTKLAASIVAMLLVPYALADNCIDSIRAYSNTESSSIIKVDVANHINIYDKTLSPEHVLKQTHPITVTCDVSELYPHAIDPENALKVAEKNRVIPVNAGMWDDIGWVLYLSAFSDGDYEDTANGLALSIVTFNPQGKIIDTLPLSAFSQYEGMIEKSSAEINNKTITFCLQEVEFFAYNENGEVDHELEKPKVSVCQIEHYRINNGVFKLVTREW